MRRSSGSGSTAGRSPGRGLKFLSLGAPNLRLPYATESRAVTYPVVSTIGAAGFPSLATPRQSVYAPVCARLEATRDGAQARSEDRLLCRWLRHLLQGQRRTGACGNAVDDGTAELTINEAKTRACYLPAERFDSLGYAFGRCYSPKTGRAYLGTRPSKKSVSRMIGSIRECTAHWTTWPETEAVVSRINAKLVGWANYFSLDPVSPAYITPLIATRRFGCTSGCAASTSDEVRVGTASPMLTCTRSWGSSVSGRARATFRGRPPEQNCRIRADYAHCSVGGPASYFNRAIFFSHSNAPSVACHTARIASRYIQA